MEVVNKFASRNNQQPEFDPVVSHYSPDFVLTIINVYEYGLEYLMECHHINKCKFYHHHLFRQ